MGASATSPNKRTYVMTSQQKFVSQLPLGVERQTRCQINPHGQTYPMLVVLNPLNRTVNQISRHKLVTVLLTDFFEKGVKLKLSECRLQMKGCGE